MPSPNTDVPSKSTLDDLRVQVIALVSVPERIRLDRFASRKKISRAAALREALTAFLDAAGAR